MKNFFYSFVFLSFLIPQSHANCTDWEPTPSTSCSFLGEWTQIWTRNCTNPCSLQNDRVVCELERICTNEDPNHLSGACTAWKEERGTTCPNPVTRRFEQKWARACTQNLAVVTCSDLNPNE